MASLTVRNLPGDALAALAREADLTDDDVAATEQGHDAIPASARHR
jgi:hypothetical protein